MMTRWEIAHRRLHTQRIAGAKFATPGAVVQWLGAVQAQEYAGAKWAVGQRMRDATDAALDQALSDGTILRTHVMRPTWHFVVPADIRWLLALTAPRVKAASAYYDRQRALDDTTFARSNAALANALQGGAHLTRAELASVLQHAGIATDDLRLGSLVMHAELDGVICSGARRDKQFTYALLDERAPRVATLARDEALAELTRRYMTSHGPATVQDFVWWSGLTMADAKAGLAMIESELIRDVVDGRTYWFAASAPIASDPSPTVYLLPNYDEYIVGYTDRRAALDALPADRLDARGNVLFNHTIVLDGQVVGTWKRTVTKSAVIVEVTPFAPLSATEAAALAVAVARYGRFIGLPAVLRVSQ
ncbi:MAG: winged helix DNA-binding domain-containing protein [Chloroflexota bacterium]|nr:winged helix DNA-binding domain-containing protein [Chloroflexota bacterium]